MKVTDSKEQHCAIARSLRDLGERHCLPDQSRKHCLWLLTKPTIRHPRRRLLQLRYAIEIALSFGSRVQDEALPGKVDMRSTDGIASLLQSRDS